MKYPDYFALQVANYGMTTDEMLKMLDDWMSDAAAALSATAHLDEIQTRGKISSAGAEENSGALDQQSLEPGMGRSGRRGQHRQIFRRSQAGVDHQDGRTILYRPRVFAVAENVSGKDPISIRCRRIRSGRRTLTLRAGMSTSRTTFVRCKASSRMRRWFHTAHHELGHGYYFKAYTRPEVPPLLAHRRGARVPRRRRGIDLARRQPGAVSAIARNSAERFQAGQDGVSARRRTRPLHSVHLFLVLESMPHWEADVYAQNLPPNEWNARWWKYVGDLQGVEPPSPRGEEFCDAATKTHINDNPAYYYNYAFATVFKFQLHDYIARKILHQPPQSCNYADNKEVGTWLE